MVARGYAGNRENEPDQQMIPPASKFGRDRTGRRGTQRKRRIYGWWNRTSGLYIGRVIKTSFLMTLHMNKSKESVAGSTFTLNDYAEPFPPWGVKAKGLK